MLKKMDKPLIIVSVVLFVFGLIMILSASSMESYMRYAKSPYYYFFKQAIFLVGGVFIFFFTILIPTKEYRKLSWPLVIVVIAALATTEVEGVAALAGNITNAVAARLGAGKLSKGVKIHINNRVITADVSINIKDGYAIPDVSAQVQDRVKQAIETMTGLSVDKVNVRITGVSVENE